MPVKDFMSYAHTKRRKLIATLKRRYPRDWEARFEKQRVMVRRQLEGPGVGMLESVAASKVQV